MAFNLEFSDKIIYFVEMKAFKNDKRQRPIQNHLKNAWWSFFENSYRLTVNYFHESSMLNNSNGIRTHNHLARKGPLNHLDLLWNAYV